MPKYRGSSHIQATIANMDTQTGVSTMVMAKSLDTGDILLSIATPISKNDTAKDLHDTLSVLGADLILKTIHGVLENSIKPEPQDHSKASYVSMLKKSDGKIDWNKSNRQICAHINAMTPWPGAFTILDNKRIKIFKAKPISCEITAQINSDANHDMTIEPNNKPGIIFKCDKQGIHATTGDGCICILELMGSSGKRLQAFQFLCGHKIKTPAKFDL
jgi:methionyl-tRNA formyltransferase